MKFGFHMQMNNWQHEISHAQLLDHIREQVQLCDALGFDAVWLPEHHLNPEGFGNAPNPILFAADPADAVPQRSPRAWELLLETAMLAGPPAHVVEQIQELREVCGIDNIITFMDAGGVPHDKIMRSLELFGAKVLPAFRAS